MTRGRHERLAAAFCIPATASRGTWPGWTPGFEGKALRANQRHHPDVRWLAAGDSFPARHLAMAAERNAAVASMDLLRIQLASRRATSQHPKAVRIRAVAMGPCRARPRVARSAGSTAGALPPGTVPGRRRTRCPPLPRILASASNPDRAAIPPATRWQHGRLRRRPGVATDTASWPTDTGSWACLPRTCSGSLHRPRPAGAVRVFRPGLAEGEAVGLGAWGGEGDLESAVGYGAGLAD